MTQDMTKYLLYSLNIHSRGSVVCEDLEEEFILNRGSDHT